MRRLIIIFLGSLLVACSSIENNAKDYSSLQEPEKKVEIFVEDNPENQVYIFESRVNKETLDKIEVLNGVKIKNISNSVNGPDTKYHAEKVVKAFADTNLDFKLNSKDELDGRRIKVNIASFTDYDERYDAKGIINMSYGYTVYSNRMSGLNSDATYFDKPLDDTFSNEYDYFIDEFSNALFDTDYTKNNQLKVKSLGNEGDEDIEDYFTTSIAHTLYQVLSPEMQKLARSEVIQVKNMYNPSGPLKLRLNSITRSDYEDNYVTLENGNKYYEVENERYNSKPFLLRSNTVVDAGFIGDETGSSFAAPHITRLAYEIKRKYPFLTYNQVKQVILTTTDSDGSEYLSNKIGWGIANSKRAIKGFGAFNAGLIEEMKFFEDNSKILEKDDTGKINFYEYLNIPSGSYVFENNIGGGLKGDGNNKENTYYKIEGKKTFSQAKKEVFEIRLPKVLDSEKNFYENIASAGLRKDGKGELVLLGKQEYKGKTQVFDGSLVLKNDSLSKYEIFKDGKLTLDGENLNINNDIVSDGIVEFLANKTNLKEYSASPNSETILHTNKKVVSDKFIVKGKLKLDFGEILNLDGSSIIESKYIDLSKSEIKNLFLEKKLFLNDKLTVNDIWRSLKDLSESEKRNIPSYDINKKKFFDSFTKNKYLPTLFTTILNVSSDNKEKAMSQIFTDNYTSFATNLFEMNNNIYVNQELNLLDAISKKKTFYYSPSISTNLLKKDNYTSFSNTLISNILGSDFSLNDNVRLGFFLGRHDNLLNFENDSKFITKNYQIGIKFRSNIGNLVFSNTSSYMYSDSNVTRNVNGEIKKTNITSNLIMNNLELGYIFGLGNSKILPSINFGFQNLKINKFEEKGKILNIEIDNNNILKYKVGANLDVLTTLNKNIELINNFKFSSYLNENIKLKGKLSGIETEFSGKNLEKYLLEYKLGINFKKNNFGLNVNIGINNQSNMKAEFKIKYEI